MARTLILLRIVDSAVGRALDFSPSPTPCRTGALFPPRDPRHPLLCRLTSPHVPLAPNLGEMNPGGLHIQIRGTVQGVGYRPWVFQLARRMDIRGPFATTRAACPSTRSALPTLWNVSSPHCAAILLPLRACGPSRIWRFRLSGTPRSPSPGRWRARSVMSRFPLIWLRATTVCASCSIPADRRYRYPFINCTNCGPRYSIVYDSPYDRGNMYMAAFRMCEACRSEYENPEDRGFMRSRMIGGSRRSSRAIRSTSPRALRAGFILARCTKCSCAKAKTPAI